MNIKIKKTKPFKKNKLYKGFGMVSGNNSSRLLMDYKYEHPDRYNELLELIFGKEHLAVTHLKVEMGSDINSSSGTEPSVMRHREEKADVTRGSAYMLACDAKKVNPDLVLDMLYWSEPRWVTDSDDVFDARYIWYKETLIQAYNVYGIKFDCVSVNRNERAVEAEWIKYFANRLKSEKNCPYDFSKILIVAADEEGSWRISDLMLSDEKLRNSVDIIGSHYTSHSTENTRILSDKYGKEVWFTEGCPPMSYSEGTRRFDTTGMSGINGVLDIANRIIAMYPLGGMTLYEFQPVVSAYYDGVTYGHKRLIEASEPWSGFYSLESGFYMALHFSKFIKKGWAFIDGACGCDGEKGGDGHAIINTVHSYIAAYDPDTEDYSIVISNSTNREIRYVFNVSGLKKSGAVLYLWETTGSDLPDYKDKYFRMAGSVAPKNKKDSFEFEVNIAPFSLVTLSTLDVKRPCYPALRSELLKLPYYDDFAYEDKPEAFLSQRGNAPKYTTDQGGAFEAAKVNGKFALMQMITPDIKAEEWGYTPLPVTNLGDDRWFNYSVSADVAISESNAPSDNYIGIGLRYSQACKEFSGYSLRLYENGHWQLLRNSGTKKEGFIVTRIKNSVNIRITAVNDKVICYIDGEKICEYTSAEEPVLCAGRAALYSSYNRNCFCDLKITPVEGQFTYIKRFDNTDQEFVYSGTWEHKLMSGFSDYKRTVSSGSAGASVGFRFKGEAFGIFGENKEEAAISLIIDGKIVWNRKEIKPSKTREMLCFISGLDDKEHIAEITVLSGELAVDGAETAIALT